MTTDIDLVKYHTTRSVLGHVLGRSIPGPVDRKSPIVMVEFLEMLSRFRACGCVGNLSIIGATGKRIAL